MVTTALYLLETIQSRGASARVDGDTLRIKPVRLVRDLDSEIRANKADLLQLLSGSEFSEPAQSTLGRNQVTTSNPRRRLKWNDVPHSSYPVPLHEPTDPARVQLANEIGHILTAFPDGGAKRLKSSNWRINGEVWEHDQAVMLASHTIGHTVNGYPLEVVRS